MATNKLVITFEVPKYIDTPSEVQALAKALVVESLQLLQHKIERGMTRDASHYNAAASEQLRIIEAMLAES